MTTILRVPVIQVLGASGVDLVPVWGTDLTKLKIVSYLDFQMDELTLTFSNKPPYKDPPPEGTQFTVSLGWSASSTVNKGVFFVQRIHLSGSPSGGETMALICRAAIVDKEFNQVDTQHFGQDNGNTTLGDVFRNLFKNTGKTVKIAPEIDGKPLPGGYYLRQNQSVQDAATELAADNGAIYKVAGDTVIVLKLDSGRSVSGNDLGPIVIDHGSCYEYDAELEPRFNFSSVAVQWFDPVLGRLKSETSPTLDNGGQGGGLPHPAASQDEAKAKATSHAADLGREAFTGLFVIPGSLTASAGSFVQTVGFPKPIDGAKLQCETLTDEVDPGKGWTTTVEVNQVPDNGPS